MGRDDTTRNQRLECLKLAVALCSGGYIAQNEVLIQAGSYFDFVTRSEKDQAHGAPDEQVSAG